MINIGDFGYNIVLNITNFSQNAKRLERDAERLARNFQARVQNIEQTVARTGDRLRRVQDYNDRRLELSERRVDLAFKNLQEAQKSQVFRDQKIQEAQRRLLQAEENLLVTKEQNNGRLEAAEYARTQALTRQTHARADMEDFMAYHTERTTRRISAALRNDLHQINALGNEFIRIGRSFLFNSALIGGVIGGLAKVGVEMDSTIQRARISLTKFTGSGKIADEMVQGLRKEAILSILTFKEMLPIAQQLTIAYGPRGLGKVIPTIRAFGDAAVTSGVNNADQTRAFRGLRQMLIINRVRQREVDLISRGLGININQILKDAFGSPEPTVLAKAGITGQKAADAILKGIQKQFHGAQEELVRTTLPGVESMFKDIGRELAGSLSQNVIGGFIKGVNVLVDSLRSLADNKSSIEALRLPFVELSKWLGRASEMVAGVVKWFNNLSPINKKMVVELITLSAKISLVSGVLLILTGHLFKFIGNMGLAIVAVRNWGISWSESTTLIQSSIIKMEAMEIEVTTLSGLLRTLGAVGAAAFIGWGIGKTLDEVFRLSDRISGLINKLRGIPDTMNEATEESLGDSEPANLSLVRKLRAGAANARRLKLTRLGLVGQEGIKHPETGEGLTSQEIEYIRKKGGFKNLADVSPTYLDQIAGVISAQYHAQRSPFEKASAARQLKKIRDSVTSDFNERVGEETLPAVSAGGLASWQKLMVGRLGDNIGKQCGEAITLFMNKVGIKATATSLLQQAKKDPSFQVGPIGKDKTGQPIFPNGTIIFTPGAKGRQQHFASTYYDRKNNMSMLLESTSAGSVKGQPQWTIRADRSFGEVFGKRPFIAYGAGKSLSRERIAGDAEKFRDQTRRDRIEQIRAEAEALPQETPNQKQRRIRMLEKADITAKILDAQDRISDKTSDSRQVRATLRAEINAIKVQANKDVKEVWQSFGQSIHEGFLKTLQDQTDTAKNQAQKLEDQGEFVKAAEMRSTALKMEASEDAIKRLYNMKPGQKTGDAVLSVITNFISGMEAASAVGEKLLQEAGQKRSDAVKKMLVDTLNSIGQAVADAGGSEEDQLQARIIAGDRFKSGVNFNKLTNQAKDQVSKLLGKDRSRLLDIHQTKNYDDLQEQIGQMQEDMDADGKDQFEELQAINDKIDVLLGEDAKRPPGDRKFSDTQTSRLKRDNSLRTRKITRGKIDARLEDFDLQRSNLEADMESDEKTRSQILSAIRESLQNEISSLEKDHQLLPSIRRDLEKKVADVDSEIARHDKALVLYRHKREREIATQKQPLYLRDRLQKADEIQAQASEDYKKDREAGVPGADEWYQKQLKQADRLRHLTVWQEMADKAKENFKSIEESFSDSVANMIVDGGNMKDWWKNTWKQMAKDMLKLGIEKMLLGFLQMIGLVKKQQPILAGATAGILGGGGAAGSSPMGGLLPILTGGLLGGPSGIPLPGSGGQGILPGDQPGQPGFPGGGVGNLGGIASIGGKIWKFAAANPWLAAALLFHKPLGKLVGGITRGVGKVVKGVGHFFKKLFHFDDPVNDQNALLMGRETVGEMAGGFRSGRDFTMQYSKGVKDAMVRLTLSSIGNRGFSPTGVFPGLSRMMLQRAGDGTTGGGDVFHIHHPMFLNREASRDITHNVEREQSERIRTRLKRGTFGGRDRNF